MFGMVLVLSLLPVDKYIAEQNKYECLIQTKFFHVLGYFLNTMVHLLWIIQSSTFAN